MCTIANFFVGLSRTATIFLDRQRPHLLVRSGQLRASTGDRERLGKKTQEVLHPRSSTGIFSRAYIDSVQIRSQAMTQSRAKRAYLRVCWRSRKGHLNERELLKIF